MKKGILFYFVGRSGSGKTTIADVFINKLKEKGIENIQIIDGDVIRSQFGDIFGYTYEERMKCNRVVRVVVQYLVDNGINVVLTQVAGYQEMRSNVRNQFQPNFVQVYVKCSLEECAKRDVKGYYTANISNINGLNDTYDEPTDSEIVLDTNNYSCLQCVEKLLGYIEENNYEL